MILNSNAVGNYAFFSLIKSLSAENKFFSVHLKLVDDILPLLAAFNKVLGANISCKSLINASTADIYLDEPEDRTCL